MVSINSAPCNTVLVIPVATFKKPLYTLPRILSAV
jgi:hypothetical protein